MKKIDKGVFLVFLMALGFVFLFSGCPETEPQDPPPPVPALVTISGSFESQTAQGNAAFFASSVENSSARMGKSLSTMSVIELEGLLEDGDITFRLRGSYDTQTRQYVLSAAGSFLRYSISGDLTNPNNSGTAIVQVRNLSDNTWSSHEVSVTASSTGIPPVIEGGQIEDELNSGLPQDMWGVWWGENAYIISEFDIIQPGRYFYVIDAFTVVLYVDRHGTWNVEGHTCFFEGVDANNFGRVVFNFTDTDKINQDYPTWWIDFIDRYAGGGILPAQWGNTDWKANVDRFAAAAAADGSGGSEWGSLFGKYPYYYQKYRKEAFRWQGSLLQMGRTEAASSQAAVDNFSFNDIKWDNNLLSRERTAPAIPYDNTLKNGLLRIPSEQGGFVYETYRGKNNVIKIPSNAHWAALSYDLSRFEGETITISASMDVMVSADTRIVWQVSNAKTASDANFGFPHIFRDPPGSAWSIRTANEWHRFEVVDFEVELRGGNFVISLYLSEMQLKYDADFDQDYNPNKVVDVYVANISITIDGVEVLDRETLVESRNADEPLIHNPAGDAEHWRLYSTKAFDIVDIGSRTNVMKVSNPTGDGNEWAVAYLDLERFIRNRNNQTVEPREITIRFGVHVMRAGAAGSLTWQINNRPDWPWVARIENAAAGMWHYISGAWTGIPTDEYPRMFLSTFENNSPETTYYISGFWVEVICGVCGYRTLWDCTCE
jgi:hypothetical protein